MTAFRTLPVLALMVALAAPSAASASALDGTIVDTRIKMRVKFGPVTLFHYDHEALEVAREGAALIVDGQDYQGEAPPDAIPSSYWNKAIVDAEYLLNTQTGALIPITKTALGRTAAPGGAIAEHYRPTGSVALDLWYDAARWVGADFIVRGEALTYRPIDDADRQRLFAKLDLAGTESAVTNPTSHWPRIPAQAGIQIRKRGIPLAWTPACAGVTGTNSICVAANRS